MHDLRAAVAVRAAARPLTRRQPRGGDFRFGSGSTQAEQIRGVKDMNPVTRAQAPTGGLPRTPSPGQSPALVVTSRAPSPRAMRFVNPFIRAVLRSPFHGLLSRQIFLLTVTGRRSGQQFTVPVGYVADANSLLVISQHSEQKRWWRNLRGGAPVTMHLRGRRLSGHAELIEAPTAVTAVIQQLIASLGPKEASARLYLSLDTTPPPTREQLAAALEGVVLVRVTPDQPRQQASSRIQVMERHDEPMIGRNRRIVVPRYGGPEVMTIVDEPIPEPRSREIRVRVIAAGLGFPDVLIREGTYPGGPRPPFTPGYELIGIVDKLGVGASGFQLGQRVGAITVYGSHADYLCVPDWWLVPVPQELDPAEAAIVVFNYVTAFQMLHRTAQCREGDRVLVHGAAGGVGTALLQLGRLAGLELFGTGSGTQTGVISALGATPIDYTRSSFVERLRELTGDGVDVALDGIGGRVALDSYRALRRGGRLVMYGHYGTTVGGRKSVRRVALFYLAGLLVFAANILPDGRRVRTFQVAKLRDQHPEWFREDAATLFELLAERKIDPIVAERIPLVEARRGHENLGRGGVVGKQVLVCDEARTVRRPASD